MAITANTSLPPLPDALKRGMANAIRALAMDAVEQANSGHPGMPMGMADAATALFSEHLRFDPAHPHWPDRDRFVLSAGHGSMLLYALLHLCGYADMTMEELKRFRSLGAKTAGHPEFGHAAGIETTTGPLGQGLANAVGMALAERMLNAQFGDALVNHYTYVIAGDGCLMEGISHEAASLAGHLRLNRLIVLFDDNGISIDGPTKITVSEDTPGRYRAYGWGVYEVDGHDMAAVSRAIAEARRSDRPSLIACKTVIGYGAPNKAGSEKTHGSPLGKEEIAGARTKLSWPHAPFELPDDVRDAWSQAGGRGKSEYETWGARLAALDPAIRDEFERRMRGDLPEAWHAAIEACKREMTAAGAAEATRVSSQKALAKLAESVPELVGGSADLTGSNNTKTASLAPVSPENYAGRYIYYGVREHAMAAAMNGIALHGGWIPYGGTFLVFSDYCRPAIRLSALMGQRVVYVMTHDSIGLGEDGPTHQPVEHLAALRAIPNLHVFRPADAVETAECWALSLARANGPSLLCLSRQNLPLLRGEYRPENLCARGGYVLRDTPDAKVSLIATGSEVSIAVAAQALLAERNIAARVVSLPCFSLFDEQPAAYRGGVLGEGMLRVGIEAAIPMGWERYLGESGIFVGMSGFGASGPAPALYEHFGITARRVADAVTKQLGV